MPLNSQSGRPVFAWTLQAAIGSGRDAHGVSWMGPGAHPFREGPSTKIGSSHPEALRTHILRLLGPETILYRVFWAILSLRVQVEVQSAESVSSAHTC